MNYPVWELELGSGMLMAIVAILHVFVSHFAIGGGFFLVLTEYYALKKNDNDLLSYLKLHSRFFALLTLVFGAISGVGIWFTIGLINPAATSALIHIFVWFWALEWIFFFIEIAAAIVYYTTWDRISQTAHFIVGWIYFISAFMSLAIINGILTFMLTPGKWIESRYVVEGFFNQTFLASFLGRTAICIALAGVYALITSPFVKEKITRIRLIRYAGVWAIVGILFALPSFALYYKQLPLAVNELIEGALPTSFSAFQVLGYSSFILALLVLIPVIVPRYFRFGFAFVILLFALMTFGASEFIRESVRKPYVIYGYMFGNTLRPDEYNKIDEKGGLLASAIFVKNRKAVISKEAGEDVFRIACRSCHSLYGYKGLGKSLTGLDEKFTSEVIARLERLRGKMPPFPGNDIEKKALAKYLISMTDHEFKFVSGQQVFKKRCNICHTKNREFNPVYPLFEDYTYNELLERISTLGSVQKKMAPWSGNNEEAKLLAGYIISWYTDE